MGLIDVIKKNSAKSKIVKANKLYNKFIDNISYENIKYLEKALILYTEANIIFNCKQDIKDTQELINTTINNKAKDIKLNADNEKDPIKKLEIYSQSADLYLKAKNKEKAAEINSLIANFKEDKYKLAEGVLKAKFKHYGERTVNLKRAKTELGFLVQLNYKDSAYKDKKIDEELNVIEIMNKACSIIRLELPKQNIFERFNEFIKARETLNFVKTKINVDLTKVLTTYEERFAGYGKIFVDNSNYFYHKYKQTDKYDFINQKYNLHNYIHNAEYAIKSNRSMKMTLLNDSKIQLKKLENLCIIYTNFDSNLKKAQNKSVDYKDRVVALFNASSYLSNMKQTNFDVVQYDNDYNNTKAILIDQIRNTAQGYLDANSNDLYDYISDINLAKYYFELLSKNFNMCYDKVNYCNKQINYYVDKYNNEAVKYYNQAFEVSNYRKKLDLFNSCVNSFDIVNKIGGTYNSNLYEIAKNKATMYSTGLDFYDKAEYNFEQGNRYNQEDYYQTAIKYYNKAEENGINCSEEINLCNDKLYEIGEGYYDEAIRLYNKRPNDEYCNEAASRYKLSAEYFRKAYELGVDCEEDAIDAEKQAQYWGNEYTECL